MPLGEGRGWVSAGQGGGGRPAGGVAGGGVLGQRRACPRRLLPLGAAPVLGARELMGASVFSFRLLLSVVRTGLGRRRLSGSLASRRGWSGWAGR
jgi:hypothetical protein